MYFGSVKFFKHIIILTIILLITIPTLAAINLGINNKRLLNIIDSTGIVVDDENGAKNKNLVSGLIYQFQHKDLTVDRVTKNPDEKRKVVYLTFDDGPSEETIEILDILKKKKVKATFFVTYKDGDVSKGIYRRIVDEGHTIGIHTASHKYTEIYSSVENYLADFKKMNDTISSLTGIKPELFRFPGGSVNAYNVEIYQELIAEMLRRGYTYHDWNVSANDLTGNATVESITDLVVANSIKHDKAIVQMHDSNTGGKTALALPEIIRQLKAEGYIFKELDPTIKPVNFSYSN